MNHYTELISYIAELGDADPYVNTITQGDFDKTDLDKGQLHPLLHINISGSSFPAESVVGFSVQIGCFSDRDTNKEIVNDRLWENDNEVDNMNETLATLNRIWLVMFRNFNENNITSAIASLEPSLFSRSKILDGWIMTLDIEMPNTDISLCQYPT